MVRSIRLFYKPTFLKVEKLIKLCAKNDRTAQSELFKLYKDILFFVSLKYCRNEKDAEDNLHDAFISIFKNIKTYKNKGSFEGWMKRITIFKAIDKYKANTYLHLEIKDDILADTLIDEEEDKLSLDQLLKLIQELPDQYRLVFNLHQLDGYSHKEIASFLKISEGTSKSNYHRAKILLRQNITALQKSTNPEKKNAWKKRKI